MQQRTKPPSVAGWARVTFCVTGCPAVAVNTRENVLVPPPALTVMVYVPAGTCSIRNCPHRLAGTLAVITVYVEDPELSDTVASPSRLPEPQMVAPPGWVTVPVTTAVLIAMRW